jgi:hypothetical protein
LRRQLKASVVSRSRGAFAPPLGLLALARLFGLSRSRRRSVFLRSRARSFRDHAADRSSCVRALGLFVIAPPLGLLVIAPPLGLLAVARLVRSVFRRPS